MQYLNVHVQMAVFFIVTPTIMNLSVHVIGQTDYFEYALYWQGS